MHNRNSLSHRSIATPQQQKEMREHVVRKLKRQRPLAETVSIHGVAFPKDWRTMQNDLRSGAP